MPIKSDKTTIKVVIGAALSSGFNSVISGSTSKIRSIGKVIKDLEKSSTVSSTAITKLKDRYNSLLGSMNNQQAILQKRSFYRSQIADIIALGASLAAPVNSAMKFESAMADVRKVVDFSTADGLQKMGASLKTLSRTIPLSVEGLAQITAAGGQLGVKEKDLIPFTTNVAKMSTAFEMLPDEAGKSMATLSNVFDIPITSLTALGDAINHISNNSAAAARGIVPALAKAGGAARQFGLSAEKTSALVGTLIAMGRAPEEAGTATAAILQRLQLADKLGAKAEKAFRKIGISAKVFGKMVSKDAQGALLKFFDAVSKVKGQDRAGVLVNIFGKNYSSTVATLIGSLDKYKQQLKLVSDPKNYAGSMEKEFLTRSATTENSLQLLKNSLSELSISLGNSLLPTVGKLITFLSSVFKTITDWTGKNPELTETITRVIGALIGLKLAAVVFGYVGTFLLGGLNKLVVAFKGLRLAVALTGISFNVFLGWIALSVGAAWLIYENWSEVSKYLAKVWDAVAPYWESFKTTMSNLGSSVANSVIFAWRKVKGFFSEIWDFASSAWESFIEKVRSLELVDGIINAWRRVKTFFTDIFKSISPIIDKITKPISKIWSSAKNGMSSVGGLFKKEGNTVSGAKLPDLKTLQPDVTRNQNNNFAVTINAVKTDDAESIAQKVTDKVSRFSKAFLYDPVPEVL